MTKVNEFHIVCAVLESDSLTVAMNDKGMTNLVLNITFNDEPMIKTQNISRVETLKLIKLLSICMFEDVNEELTDNAAVLESVSLESNAHRKRAYLYVGIDCIGLDTKTCRKLRDELERGLNA